MPTLHADAPISHPVEDRLDRSPLVKLIAAEILQAPSQAGFVLSLMGPWGTGKTSVLNLIKDELGDRAEVLRFDPWLFSGAEQLVTRFFSELEAQLRNSKSAKLRALAKRLANYGDVVAPLAPLVLGRTGAAVAPIWQRSHATFGKRRTSASQERLNIQHRLAEIDRPIVVFIDDLDRLAQHEVCEVVRLVKLVGDLPGVRYLLAFDRRHVEQALGDQVEGGRAYLEKIVQAPHDLPLIGPTKLRRLAQEELNERFTGTELSFFSQDVWRELFRVGIGPMLRTLRDARRFANVAPAALKLTCDEVAAHDVLALEALRLFDPEVHSALPDLADLLTGSTSLDMRPQKEIDSEAHSRMNETLERSARPKATRELLRLLFPQAGHLFGGSRYSGGDWRVRRRVADRSVLNIYLRATVGENAVTTAKVREALQAIQTPARLRELLESAPDNQLADLCDRLTELQSAFPAEHSGEAARVVALQELRFSPHQRSTPEGWSVSMLVVALLHQSADPAAAVKQMVDTAPNLSHALHVAKDYGTFKDREDRSAERAILDEQATTTVMEKIRSRVQQATPDQLRSEPELRSLLEGLLFPDEAAGRAYIAAKTSDDAIMRALVRQSFGWGLRSNDMGTVHIPELDWKSLTRMLGHDVLVQRVNELAPQIEPDDKDERVAWKLAKRYADGETPPSFP